MDKNSNSWGVVLGIGLLAGLFVMFMASRSKEPVQRSSIAPDYSLVPQEANPPVAVFKPTGRQVEYNNEEVWDITWNEDGLPSKVVIHRHAVQG